MKCIPLGHEFIIVPDITPYNGIIPQPIGNWDHCFDQETMSLVLTKDFHFWHHAGFPCRYQT